MDTVLWLAMGLLIALVSIWLFLKIYFLFHPLDNRLEKFDATHGSSRWADTSDLEAAGLLGKSGYRLGVIYTGKKGTVSLRYSGDRHLLTVAPTRGGKGVSTIIPNLLTHPGSTLVIDPKGENALITANARRDLGQKVYVVDPWKIACTSLDLPAARFNPMDWLIDGDPDLSENAMLLADALIISRGARDPFWDEEARALIYGFLLYLTTEPSEWENRNLGRLRDILTLPPRDPFDPDAPAKGTIDEIIINMEGSMDSRVRASSARYLQKADKERSGIMSSAQSHTHFLESPRIRESLSVSDFSFESLKNDKISVYLILPADRLSTFNRWLRLLIQQAITQTARNIAFRPKHPVLFMLDEMAALGHLQMIEQSYSLMAGFGMQLWGIVQDLSQLERIYGGGWQTFVSNSGVLQYFGSRDKMTAEYFSALCGVRTAASSSHGWSESPGGPNSSFQRSTHGGTSETQRPLAFPDELMTMRRGSQLLLVENAHPILGRRVSWFQDDELRHLGVNLHRSPSDNPKQFSENGILSDERLQGALNDAR